MKSFPGNLISQVQDIMRSCNICPRNCGVNRLAGEPGFCGVGVNSKVFYQNILYGEEVEICPTCEIFFTGCNMRCSYCYVREWVTTPDKEGSKEICEIVNSLDKLQDHYRSISIIGGEPTVNILSVLELLGGMKKIPYIVWNSNMYMSEAIPEMLSGLVDLYIADIRFYNDECSFRVAETKDYFKNASRAILNAASMTKIILRHLLIPGHLECCFIPIANWVKHNLPDIPFHIMENYYSGTGDSVSAKEIQSAKTYAHEQKLNLYKPTDTFKEEEIKTGFFDLQVPDEEVIIEESGKVVFKHLTREFIDIGLLLDPMDKDLCHRKNIFPAESKIDEQKNQ